MTNIAGETITSPAVAAAKSQSHFRKRYGFIVPPIERHHRKITQVVDGKVDRHLAAVVAKNG
jgi:hypothetical protein